MTKSLVITYDEIFDEETGQDVLKWSVTVQDIQSYDELNSALKGWIEAIPTDNRVTIWCNEEGKINNLPDNLLATHFWTLVDSFGCVRAGDWICGPAVVQGPPDEEGNNTDCPEWVLEHFAKVMS